MTERIWDRFLTEQDHAHLAIRGARLPRAAVGSRPAVVSIDNYRGAAGDEPLDILDAVRRWPRSMGRPAWTALDKIAELLASARGASIPVIHVTGLPESESGIRSRVIHQAPAEMSPEERARHERHYETMPQAAPVDGEVVLKKIGPSGFFGTPLLAVLNLLDIDTLILVGESTSGCVRATAVDANAYRYKVVVVEDCVYDRHEASHAMSLFDINQKYGVVLPLDEVQPMLSNGTFAPRG